MKPTVPDHSQPNYVAQKQTGFTLIATLILIGILALLLAHYFESIHIMNKLLYQSQQTDQYETIEKSCLNKLTAQIDNGKLPLLGTLKIGQFSPWYHCGVFNHNAVDYQLMPLVSFNNNALTMGRGVTMALEILVRVSGHLVTEIPGLSAVWWHIFTVSPIQNQRPSINFVIQANQLDLNVAEQTCSYPVTGKIQPKLVHIALRNATPQIYYAQANLLIALTLPERGHTLRKLWQHALPGGLNIIDLSVFGNRLWFIAQNHQQTVLGVLNRFSGHDPNHSVFINSKKYMVNLSPVNQPIIWRVSNNQHDCRQTITVSGQAISVFLPRYHCGLQMLRVK